MPIAAVTFDFHNTLAECDAWFALETRELAPETLRLLAADGLAPDDDALRDRARLAYREVRQEIVAHGEERAALACALEALGRVGVAAPEGAVAAAIERLMRGALAGVRPLPGAVAAVRELGGRGLRCGVVSSAVHHPFVEWALARCGLRDAFGAVVTSASSGYYKSRPEIYRAALRALDADATTTVHVGDSYRFDVEGARRAGLRAIWYASTTAALERALVGEAVEADATVADLATLPAVIATLARG
jgi:putative hydrolase of the HAD superfamily